MSSLNKIRFADGREFSISEVYHQPRYSTVEIGATDPVNLFSFSYVPGQPVSKTASITSRNATERDTNMVRPGAMNQDEALAIQAITFEAYGLDSESDNSGNTIAAAPMLSGIDLRRLQRDIVFELRVGGLNKPMYQIPFVWLCQSMAAEAFVSDTGSTTTRLEYGTAGEVSAMNQEALELPIYAGGWGIHARPGNSMLLKGKLFCPSGAITGLRQNVRLVVVLDGLSKRPA